MTRARASFMLATVRCNRRRAMTLLALRPPLAALAVLLLGSACTSVRLAPPPAAPAPPSDVDRYPAPRQREPPPAPIESPPPPSAVAPPLTLPAGAAAVPLPPPDAPAVVAQASPPSSPAITAASSPRVAAPAAHPAPGSTPADGGATALAPGRWSVQVGVFSVPQNAETIRARVEQRLNGAAIDAAHAAVRTARRDGLVHVLVGNLPDRQSAQRFAVHVRSLLQQDVVLFRW
jgi:hypothetical protein